ncbi:MAG: bifunctional riboflavin kinase/FAD synthetase [Bosea sp. (in: a-proteobacteria)]
MSHPAAAQPAYTRIVLGEHAVAACFRGTVLALGNFDGVHRGHAELAREAVELGEMMNRRPAVLTFEPHPRSFFRPEDPVFRLTPPEVKAELLAELGIKLHFVLPFDRAIAATSARDFINGILCGQLGAAAIVCGYDFHFGKGRAGSPEMLTEMLEEELKPVIVVPPFQWQGETVSSSLIRTALGHGDVARAAEFLGHPWFVRGEVAHGDKRGRDLGYPTANLHLPRDCRLKYGIYAVRMKIDGVWRDGVASFGSRPTFDDGAPRLETFVFDFSGDLYGKSVDVAFVGFLRGEEKFASLEALIVQMDSDSVRARALLAETPPFLP